MNQISKLFLLIILIFPFNQNGFGITIDLGINLNFQEDTIQLNNYAKRAIQCLAVSSRREESKSIIDEAFIYAQKKNIEVTPLLHLAKAELMLKYSDYKSSSEEASIALKQSKAAGEDYVTALTLNFLGLYCNNTGFFKECQDYYEEAIKFATKKEMVGIIPKAYEGLANLNTVLKNDNETTHFLELMLNAAIAENNNLIIQNAYYRLGHAEMYYSKNYQKSLNYLKNSYEYSKKLNDSTRMASTIGRIAWNYYLQHMLDSSLQNFQQLLIYIQN